MDKLVNVSQAAEMLGVSTKIMRIWDNEGKVEAVRTAGGHRRYRLSEIEKLQGIKHEEVKKPDQEKVCSYSRVSQRSRISQSLRITNRRWHRSSSTMRQF